MYTVHPCARQACVANSCPPCSCEDGSSAHGSPRLRSKDAEADHFLTSMCPNERSGLCCKVHFVFSAGFCYVFRYLNRSPNPHRFLSVVLKPRIWVQSQTMLARTAHFGSLVRTKTLWRMVPHPCTSLGCSGQIGGASTRWCSEPVGM